MPLFSVMSIAADGEPPKTTERWARSRKEIVEQARLKRRQVIDAVEIPLKRARPDTFAFDKQRLFHRFAQAMAHRGYDQRTTAINLEEAFPNESKAHRLIRSFLKTAQDEDLPQAMAQHPHLFSPEQIEGIGTSANRRETLALFARTSYDTHKLSRDMWLVLGWPVVAFIAFIGFIIYTTGWVIPSLQESIFPHASEIPAIFEWLSNFHDWLTHPLNVCLLIAGIAVILGTPVLAYRMSPPFQAYTRGVLFTKARSYGRVLHQIERRHLYTAWIHQIASTGGTDTLPERGAEVVSEVGKRAFERAIKARPEGSNPLTRLRAASPYLPKAEVGELVSAYAESGVTGTTAALERLVTDINENIPYDRESAKREIQGGAFLLFGTLLGSFFILLGSAILALFFHLHT